VSSVDKAISGFRKSGIYPCNRDIFTDEDFMAARATDRLLAESEAEHPSQMVICTALDDCY